VAVNRSFIQGALILTVGGIISKLLGAAYRIPFANLVGNEGIGLYQMAYPIYIALLALSTGGIPVAVSIMVAERLSKEDRRGANRVLLTAVLLLGVLGLGLSVGLYMGSAFIADRLLYDSRAIYSLMFISPALFFTAVVSPLRGYFQGGQNMVPTAVSQVVEQLARVLTVFAGAYLFLPYGIEFAAAGATFGAVTGGAAALLVLIIFGYRTWSKGSEPTGLGYLACVRRLGTLALPVCLGGLVLPLMQGIDAVVVPQRLQLAGYDVSGATALYGELTGMAGPLINLTGVVTTALAASLVPAVSTALGRGDSLLLKRRVEDALRLAALICVPAAVGLVVLAEPISRALYNLPSMGQTLASLAPAAFFLGMHQALSGALQGMGKTGLPVRNLVLGACLKLGLTYYLTALPNWGVRGAAIGSVAGFALAAALNFWEVYILLPGGLQLSKLLLKPTLAGTIMAVILLIMKNDLASDRFGGFILVAAGGFVYLLSLLFSGELKAGEISRAPWLGRTLAQWLLALGIVRE